MSATKRKFTKEVFIKGVRYVDVDLLSEQTGLSVSHLRFLARQNDIPATKVGRRWYFNPDKVDEALLDENSRERQYGKPTAVDELADL